ncbi:MAG TPA: tetratricopeptide repeat protein [Bacteroidetes bacterium]|nr:tetratricopeptide repeat protein [Bacteroidota bacterium]
MQTPLADVNRNHQATLQHQERFTDDPLRLSHGDLLPSFSVSSLVLLVPTTLMGGTLPVLSKALVRSRPSAGADVGVLYTVNTAGAVAGAVAAGFFLIPWLGVREATYFAATWNLAVGVVAILVSRRVPATAAHVEKLSPVAVPFEKLLLLGALAWGFAAFCYEVFWTRVLLFIFSSSTYAFSIMLITFLLGLALGAGVGSLLASRVRRPLLSLAWVEIAVGVVALGSLWALGHIGDMYAWTLRHIRLVTWWHWNLMRFLEAVAVMLPATLLMGMTFPLAIRVLSPERERVGSKVGLFYGYNTVGAVLGSLAASFVILPLVGTRTGLLLASFLNLAVGVAFLVALSQSRWRTVGLGLVGAGGVLMVSLVVFPGDYLATAFNFNQKGSKLVYVDEGVNGTVTVHQYPDNRVVCVNNVLVAGTAFDLRTTQKLQGHIPMLLHPHPRKVMQVGFGTGETSRVVGLYGVARLDAVELVPEIVKASRFFVDINGRVFEKAFFNPIFADGKNYASLTREKYDVIMNDSVHPAEVANASLYTLEYFKACRERLAEDGLMSSWLPLFGLAPEDLKSILKTFQAVFPHASLWIANNCRNRHALLIGWKEDRPLRIDFDQIRRKMQDPAVKEDLAGIHMQSPYDVIDCLVLDEDGIRKFTAGAPLNTDDHPFLDFHTPRVYGPDELIWARNLEQVLRYRCLPWKLVQVSGPDSAEVLSRIRRTAMASSFVWQGIIRELRGDVAAARLSYSQAAQLNPDDPDPTYLLAASRARVESLRKLVEADPRDFETRLRLGVLYLGLGKIAEAEKQLQEALRLDPGSAEAHANLATVLLAKGQGEKALAELGKARKLDPKLSLVYYNLGFALVQVRKDYQAAVQAWERAVQLDPTYEPAHYNLGLALLSLGRREEAARALERALDLQPTDLEARRVLAYVYTSLGDTTRARELGRFLKPLGSKE